MKKMKVSKILSSVSILSSAILLSVNIASAKFNFYSTNDNNIKLYNQAVQMYKRIIDSWESPYYIPPKDVLLPSKTEIGNPLLPPFNFRAVYPVYDRNYKGSITIELTWQDNSDDEDGFRLYSYFWNNNKNPAGYIDLPPNTTKYTLVTLPAPYRARHKPRPELTRFELTAYNEKGETFPVTAGARQMSTYFVYPLIVMDAK
jgi:hypothetical protein